VTGLAAREVLAELVLVRERWFWLGSVLLKGVSDGPDAGHAARGAFRDVHAR
jgi:hypothetical protein